jgi:transcriptional antiterminator Rof (Rho-off)
MSPRVQEVRDDEELHDGVPINRELAVASQLSSVEVSPGGLEPARPPDTSILMGALVENWIDTKYPGVSREHRRALFHEIAIEMTGSTGIDFEAAAHDSLATKRTEYISAVENYAAARFDHLRLDVVAPTAQSAALPPSCPNTGNGAVRGIIFPPRIVPKRSLSMPDERTMVASRALVKVMEASPFPTVHVQDSVIIGQQALAKTSRLHEEYLVHEMIGKGGFGEVFKVVHKLDHVCTSFVIPVICVHKLMSN